jgi:hypothetical protein
MGVLRQSAQRDDHRLGQWRARQVRVLGPLPGPQQLGNLGVRARADDLLDRVTAVRQPAVGAVDLGECGFAGEDALEAG